MCAIVVPKAGHSLAETDVIAFCRENLASFKKPRNGAVIAAELPKNATGKVLKRELRDLYVGQT